MEIDPRYADCIVQRLRGVHRQAGRAGGDGRTFEEVAQERREEAGMNRALPPGDRGRRSPAPRGHPDVEGLCLALADWSAELRLLEGHGRWPALRHRWPTFARAVPGLRVGQGCRERAWERPRRCNGSTGGFQRNQAWGLRVFFSRNTMRSCSIPSRERTPMFLIDSHGKRPVCIACHGLGPYQEAEPRRIHLRGVRPGRRCSSSEVGRECSRVAGPSAETLAEGCDCERCRRRGDRAV